MGNVLRFLPPGRLHELELGMTVVRNEKSDAGYLDFQSSVLDVMNHELFIPAGDGEPEVVYDPSNPTWGRSGELFSVVKDQLPGGQLQFYIAIDSVLDHYHGVDYFFLWHGVYAVMFDLSLRVNEKEDRQSVDFVVSLQEATLAELGKEIARLLKIKKRDGRRLVFLNEK